MTEEPEKKKVETEEEADKVEEETKEEEKDPKDLIARAEDAASRIEKANEVSAQLLAKKEALVVEDTLSGNAEAGTHAKRQTKDEKETAEAKEYLKGTGLEDEAFPDETRKT